MKFKEVPHLTIIYLFVHSKFSLNKHLLRTYMFHISPHFPQMLAVGIHPKKKYILSRNKDLIKEIYKLRKKKEKKKELSVVVIKGNLLS